MSSVRPIPRRRRLQPDLRPQHRVFPLVFSVLIHVTLLLLVTSAMRWFQAGPFGFGNDPTSGIGLTLEGGDGGGSGGTGTELPGDPNAAAPMGTAVELAPATDQFTPKQATADTPPAEISIPTADTAVQNGRGQRLPTGSGVGDALTSIKSHGGSYQGTKGQGSGSGGGNGNGSGSGGGGRGSINFIGIRDDGGSKVVFVIDASGSMTSYNAMQFAKNSLLSCLQGLDEHQQFLIIFYDDKPHVVKLHEEAKPSMAPATDLNKTLARQKISGIQPGAGTDHLPPLKMALQMNPDVIFFLTDALEPPLWPQDLEQIKNMNGGRIRIHCIEFGQGPELGSDSDLGNFLRKLARQNQGTYKYQDVTRLKSPVP